MRTSAPDYIRERHESDPQWVRRHRRSLGANKQFRACIRKAKEAEAKKAERDAQTKVEEKVSNVIASATKTKEKLWGRVRQFFTRRVA